MGADSALRRTKLIAPYSSHYTTGASCRQHTRMHAWKTSSGRNGDRSENRIRLEFVPGFKPTCVVRS